MLGSIIAIVSLGFAMSAFAQGVGVNIQLPGFSTYFFIPFGTSQQVTLSLATGASQPSVTAPGTYDQKISVTPSLSLAHPAPLRFDVFTPYPPALVAQQAVTINTGLAPTIATLPGLSPGYYETALYTGTTQVSNRVYFSVGPTSGSTGGLYVAFPPGQQNITPTSATLTGVVSVGYTMPVRLSYVWAKQGSPFSNETSLINMISPGMMVGSTQNITLSMTGLTPGTTYQFAMENKVSNTLSSTLQFTTPTTGSANSLDGTTTTANQAPPATPPVVDTISGTGIVPSCGRTPGNPGVTTSGPGGDQTRMCTLDDFIVLIGNIFKYAIIILGPIVAIVAMYAGAMIIWLKKLPDMNSDQMASLQKYKTLLVRVAVGVLIILSAWILIATIIRELDVKPNYSLLDTTSH